VNKITLFIFSFVCLSVYAQGQTTFERTYGEGNIHGGFTARHGCQTSDGGYIIAGGLGIQNYYAVVVKTDYKGDTLWMKTYADLQCSADFVQQTTDGGYIILGGVSNSIEKIYLLRTDSNGDTLWTKSYAGWRAYSIQQTNDGGFIISAAYSITSSNNDAYLIKINSNGNIQWAKTYGGTGADYATSVIQANDNGYIFMGYTTSFGVGKASIYFVKTDSNGNILWEKVFGGQNEECNSFKQTIDGGYILTGGTYDNANNTGNTFLLKTDANGNVIWEKDYHTTGSTNYEKGNAVDITNDGGYIIVGDGAGGNYGILIKTDFAGSIQWTKKYQGQMQWFIAGQSTTDNGYILIGSIYLPATSDAFYLVKTDSMGNSCNDSTISMSENIITTQSGITNTQISSIGSENSTNTNIYKGGKFSVLCLNTSINENSEQPVFSIYPNPSSGIFTVNLRNCQAGAKVIIRDVLGNCLLEKNCRGETSQEINLSCQPRGIYFVELLSGEDRVVKKVAVQ
jgi:hypothetical protein